MVHTHEPRSVLAFAATERGFIVPVGGRGAYRILRTAAAVASEPSQLLVDPTQQMVKPG